MVVLVMTIIVFIKYLEIYSLMSAFASFKTSFKSPFEKLYIFHGPFLNSLQRLSSLLKAKTAFQRKSPGLPKAETLSCFYAFKSGESS